MEEVLILGGQQETQRRSEQLLGREGKADLGREVQNTQIEGGKVFQLRLVVEFSATPTISWADVNCLREQLRKVVAEDFVFDERTRVRMLVLSGLV